MPALIIALAYKDFTRTLVFPLSYGTIANPWWWVPHLGHRKTYGMMALSMRAHVHLSVHMPRVIFPPGNLATSTSKVQEYAAIWLGMNTDWEVSMWLEDQWVHNRLLRQWVLSQQYVCAHVVHHIYIYSLFEVHMVKLLACCCMLISCIILSETKILLSTEVSESKWIAWLLKQNTLDPSNNVA